MAGPVHNGPQVLGPVSPTRDLVIDFAPMAMATPVLTAPLMEVSVAVYLLASAVVVGLFLLWLDRRVAGVSVLLDGDQLHVRTVFRSYRHPNASVTRVVSRRAWFGSVYASCLAVHTSARIVQRHRGNPCISSGSWRTGTLCVRSPRPCRARSWTVLTLKRRRGE